MRYLLHQNQISELKARQSYLFDIFHLYFLPSQPEGSYISLTPLGSGSPDMLFITGHTDQVLDYLNSHIRQVPEHCIVITSCMGRYFRNFAAQKEIYVPDIHNDFCLLRNGSNYGFGFYISDAELDFYNASGSIENRVRLAYDRL